MPSACVYLQAALVEPPPTSWHTSPRQVPQSCNALSQCLIQHANVWTFSDKRLCLDVCLQYCGMQGEMGLSIMMTTASTLAAIVMTPLLTTWLAGTLVPVDPQALFLSTCQVCWQVRHRPWNIYAACVSFSSA